MKQKIVDTSIDISEGGRARMYWAARKVSGKQQKLTQSTENEVDLQAILKTYNLKGFEFGNWLNNDERYDHVLACQSALADLASIIGSKNIGMDTLIGIAFGARGTSKALAHYEPRLNMINLTKEKGAGSLAHEYGHAIDFNIGRFIDQHPRFQELTAGCDMIKENKLITLKGGDIRCIANIIVTAIKKTPSYARMKERQLNEYWFRPTELFARAFEQYISFRLKKRNRKNLYLAKSWTHYTTSPVYWKENEFEPIAKLFNRFMLYLKDSLQGKQTTGNGKWQMLPPAAPARKATKTTAKTTTAKSMAAPKKTAQKKAATKRKTTKKQAIKTRQ